MQPRISSDGARLPQSRLTRTDARCCFGDSATVCSTCSPSGTTSEHSTPGHSEVVLTWLQQVSPVSPSASQESSEPTPTSAMDGLTRSGWFVKYDRDTSSWRTSQGYLLDLTGTSDVYSETWPVRGSMRSGACWVRTMSGLPTPANDSGYSLPTPMKQGYGSLNGRPGLKMMARRGMWPTPHKNCSTGAGMHGQGGENLQTAVGGSLNPTWVEWLMGWPLGHTDLKPSETDRFRQWLRSHGTY